MASAKCSMGLLGCTRRTHCKGWCKVICAWTSSPHAQYTIIHRVVPVYLAHVFPDNKPGLVGRQPCLVLHGRVWIHSPHSSAYTRHPRTHSSGTDWGNSLPCFDASHPSWCVCRPPEMHLSPRHRRAIAPYSSVHAGLGRPASQPQARQHDSILDLT